MTLEEKYKLTLFGVVRNNFILPVGIQQGRSEKEISAMTIATMKNMMENVCDFDRLKKHYEMGCE